MPRHPAGVRRAERPGASKLERYELIGPLEPTHFFPTLDAAIEAYRRQTGTDWTAPPGG